MAAGALLAAWMPRTTDLVVIGFFLRGRVWADVISTCSGEPSSSRRSQLSALPLSPGEQCSAGSDHSSVVIGRNSTFRKAQLSIATRLRLPHGRHPQFQQAHMRASTLSSAESRASMFLRAKRLFPAAWHLLGRVRASSSRFRPECARWPSASTTSPESAV